MNILKFECKKFFIKQKGLLILFFLIVIQMLLMTQTVLVPNPKIELSKQDYFKILKELDLPGQINDGKINRFDNYKDKTYREDKELTDLFHQFANGEIESSEYLNSIAAYDASPFKTIAVEQISNQIEYAKSNPERHYIAYTNGWESVFQQSGEYITVIFIIILSWLIFALEYDNKMDSYFLTVKKGRTHTIFSKLILLVSITALFVFMSQLLSAWSINLEYKLCNWNYPIQTLTGFSNCQYNISIKNTFLLNMLMKFISYLATGMTTGLFFVLFRNSFSGIAFSLIVNVLPVFITNGKKNYFPPTSFLKSEIFFKGMADFNQSATSILVIAKKEMLFILFISIFYVLFCSIGSVLLWNKKN